MNKFIIADQLIEVIADHIYSFSELQPFATGFEGKPDLKINIRETDYIEKPCNFISSDKHLKCYKPNTKEVYFSICLYKADDIIIYRLDVNENLDKASFYHLKGSDGEYTFAGPLGGIIFSKFLINHQSIVIHASAIKWEDKCIMFSAPSGAGKSTQSKLWNQYKDAVTLNDDSPAIKIIDKKPYVYGTPWSGSKSVFINDSAPLAAIIMLKQAADNEITRLSREEAMLELFPEVFFTYFDEILMEKAMDIFEKIIDTTPVYLLKCRLDRDSVELVSQLL